MREVIVPMMMELLLYGVLIYVCERVPMMFNVSMIIIHNHLHDAKIAQHGPDHDHLKPPILSVHFCFAYSSCSSFQNGTGLVPQKPKDSN